MSHFQLVTAFEPKGDQPQAIDALARGIARGVRHQTLLGVTGSGKTFTMASVIARVNRPALVIAPNKTLAAQLFGEFKQLFPHNAVEYFVSYYDYYQPEAYVPSSDTYIEKDASINERIDKLRHSATRSLLERRDVLIVASVSCIYGLGSPEAYHGMLLCLDQGQEVGRRTILSRLIEMQYDRNDTDFHRGTFRVRGDTIEIFPAHEDEHAIRIELWGDEIDALHEIDPLRGKATRRLERVTIYPASHYVTEADTIRVAMSNIGRELEARLSELHAEGRLLEAQRLESRTRYDLEMLAEMGYCTGIENYSRHLTGRRPGDPPPTLLDFFPRDFVTFIDESHIAVPQIGGMYRGDRARKETLVEHGFRLPSALDNRPLRFDEFQTLVNQVIYVSATPAEYELRMSKGLVVEQIVRPTGLLEPRIEVRPAATQVDDVLEQIRARVEADKRVLVTTLTKRMAEDLTEYLADVGIRARYLHSDIDTLERIEIIQDLRLGEFDVLVGINLLREGLDIPEVSLVAILDADKEGFLRSERSLIQTCGRAARNVDGMVILYADQVTRSMQATIDETNRRRKKQQAFNAAHGITPLSIKKDIHNLLESIYERDYVTYPAGNRKGKTPVPPEDRALSPVERERRIRELTKEMKLAAEILEFERAAELRDRIKALEQEQLGLLGAR